MNISLPPELEKFVTSRVDSGMYSSASEVVREALRLLKDKELLKELKLQELKKAIQEGVDSGEPEPLEDIESIIAEASTTT